MKKALFFAAFLAASVFALVFSLRNFFPNYFRNAILQNIPFLSKTVQKEFKTYTSIGKISETRTLVSARQQLDFINIMEGKDGRYVEIATYEVRTGVDFSGDEPKVGVVSSDKIHSLVLRKRAEGENSRFYAECIRPVNIAYEQKARDYAVSLGILERARKAAESTLEGILAQKISLGEERRGQSLDFPFIPLKFEVSGDFFERNRIELEERPAGVFFRDSLVLRSSANGGWKIRVGDSGRTFGGKFDEFYASVLKTNSDSGNERKDRVEIFRYFDPLHPKQSEILSYASDNFRTFFVLNGGRIYYIDVEYKNEQSLVDFLSPLMVYLACSVRPIEDRKVDFVQEYHTYIENFFDAAESVRNNDDRNILSAKTENLLNSKISAELTGEEKILKAVCDLKNLGRNDYNSVQKTGDEDLDSVSDLIESLKVSRERFSDEGVRERSIETASRLNEKIRKGEGVNLALHQYLESFFLQNSDRFSIPPEIQRKYEEDLSSGKPLIASRPLISGLTDAQRNRYFFELFRNRLSMSHRFVDTAERISDSLKFSERGNLAFAYFNIPALEEMSDGEVLERIRRKNGGREIDNAFVLLFCQREFDFGILGADDDIHALVFDEATLRLFLNVGSQNIAESAAEKVGDLTRKFLRRDGSPEFFFYGDWKKLFVSAENVRIAGQNFATKKVTRAAALDWRSTNDYAEKSAIARTVEDLQHAYSSNDEEFYYDTLCENLEGQARHYAYARVFRPSPRFVLDSARDEMKRYNY